MFSFLRKEDPPLQLYGKLPLAKDYLRIGASEGAGRRWREWMDRAFGAGGEGVGRLAPWRFLVAARSQPALLGVLWPSSDAGGLRPFPFALWVERTWSALLAECTDDPARAEAWWGALESLGAEARGFADGAALLAGLRGRRIASPPDPNAEPAAEPTLGEWTSLSFPDGIRGLEAVLAELASEVTGPLRMPVTRARPRSPQVAAWLRALGSSGALGKKAFGTLFVPLSEGWEQAGAGAELLFVPARTEVDPGLLARSVDASADPAAPEGAGLEPAGPGSRPSLANALCDTLERVRARGPGA